MESDLEAGADEIVEARASGAKLSSLAESHQPRSLGDAYKIQTAAASRWRDEVVGWKVGATSLEVQKLFGISHPVYGPVFKRDVFESPARLKADDFQHLMLETEFAFRLGADLPPRSEPYAREEIAAAVEALFPALEIISPRFTRLTVDNIPQLVADSCGNGGAVFGASCTDWQVIDLALQPVRIVIDGKERQSGTGAAVLGHPVNVLEWFVNERRAQGKAIAKGQFVMTGTMTGLHAPEPGEPALADFGRLGVVEVQFD
jgi:2-keto-4-pentenoate hydratase